MFNGHGVVALKFNALVLAFRLEETEAQLTENVFTTFLFGCIEVLLQRNVV